VNILFKQLSKFKFLATKPKAAFTKVRVPVMDYSYKWNWYGWSTVLGSNVFACNEIT